MPSESEIISRLRRLAGVGDEVAVGIGDDAAVVSLPGGRDLIACCDLMVEGVHFRTEWTTPRLLGRKALAVNLSDIAAMGGLPRFAMISIAIPHKCSSEFIDELFAGLFELADASGVSIIGGDTSSSRDSLFIDVSVIGECESGQAVTRRGAKTGDRIYVSGSLGASSLGLSLLEDGFRLEDLKDRSDARQQAIFKHLAPEPRLKLGRALGEARLATSMIDISDGLSTDLWHVLDESDCGAIIHAEAIPIAECVRSVAAAEPGLDPLRLALNGGEEYELLFAVRPEYQQRAAELATVCGIEITAVGEIVAGRGLQLEREGSLEAVQPAGYEHRFDR
ncbi:MAG: thiamine-phosphate kinase [Acidobacteriota bacterium]